MPEFELPNIRLKKLKTLSGRDTSSSNKEHKASLQNGWNLLQYYYKTRERLKRRYFKDERISVLNYMNSSISLPGLIKVAFTQHRSNTLKIPWPFRIFFKMFARTDVSVITCSTAAQNQSGVKWQTFPYS